MYICSMRNLTRICKKCGNPITYSDKYKLERAIKKDSPCRSCSITNRNKNSNRTKENNPAWKGYGNIPFSWFSKYFIRKGRTGKTGNITIYQIANLYLIQEGKCALSKVPIGWNDDGKGHTCSIDRIDSNRLRKLYKGKKD